MNSFSFFLVWEALHLPFDFEQQLCWYSNLDCRSQFFMTLNISCQSLLACKVSFEKSADSHMGTPLQVTLCFSLAAFNILFIFKLWHFNYDVSRSGPLCIHLVWDSVLPGLACLFPSPNQGSFLSLFLNTFPISCSLSSPFGTPMM